MVTIKAICDFIHNYFEAEKIEGSFTIAGGELQNVAILENQYFRVQGSVFNDGIYKAPKADLTDETFRGTITLMAVPKDVLDVLTRATQWEADNANTLNSPYTSESFGGYSYTKGTSTHKDGSSGQLTWRDVFGSELKAYRKIG